jgi:hypothetical protein
MDSSLRLKKGMQILFWISNMYAKNKRSFTFSKRGLYLTTVIILLVGAYFFLSLYVLPHQYATLPKVTPKPIIDYVVLSHHAIHLGKTFYFNISTENAGDSADIQIISVGFPNLTRTEGFVQIRESDFNQKPLFIKKAEKVGFNYQGTENLIPAKYPSIEAFSRPWHTHVIHHIQFQVKPSSIGRFIILSKSIALPHLNQFAHYPLNGLRDYQNEFTKVDSIQVL